MLGRRPFVLQKDKRIEKESPAQCGASTVQGIQWREMLLPTMIETSALYVVWG